MRNQFLITQGKILSKLAKIANLGHGSTWPGHIALTLHTSFIKDLLKKSKTRVVFIVGTNGKTTTTTLLRHILKTAQKKVIHNESGANLLNGIASTLLLHSSPLSAKVEADIALFEVDENAFPLICEEITPDMIVFLNLFRDQLDRYGEVNTVAFKWQETLTRIPSSTRLFLNADDPQIAFLGQIAKQRVSYFGVNEPQKKQDAIDHSSDSTYCPNCETKLTYSKNYYSHIGIWTCPGCEFSYPSHVFTNAPSYPLYGLYNKYNVNAATLVAEYLGVPKNVINKAFSSFQPAFGRQEKLVYEGKSAEIILVKNPAGFNQALVTVLEQKAKHLLLVLNDRSADGTDISWIWDIDVEQLHKVKDLKLTLSGQRVYELALRLKYGGFGKIEHGTWNTENTQIIENLQEAITRAFSSVEKNEKLYILPTYTAMLEVRKLLTGKKIL